MDFLSWGRLPYREAWQRQKELLLRRQREEIPDTLVLCEHEPVITLGRGAQREKPAWLDLLPVRAAQAGYRGLDIVEIERGGLATYHGPGQVVAYPIFKLDRKRSEPGRRGVLDLVRTLECWVIAYLEIEKFPRPRAIAGRTGVWVGAEGAEPRKIASLGIAVSHWVSYHGVALNVHTDSAAWRLFDPCGFNAEVMCNMNDFAPQAGYTVSDVSGGLQRVAEEIFR